MSCRFTTCLDSRKTGHRVRKSVFTQDVKRYGWGLPECLQKVERYGSEWNQSDLIRRDKALGPFVLDSLRDYGAHLARTFLNEYKNLSGQPEVSKFTTVDRHLLGPHQQIEKALSEMVSLPSVGIKELILEARRELRMIENHVDEMKSEWSHPPAPSAKKKSKSESAQNLAIAALRRKFASGPDVPHLSRLGDISAIRASYAYKQCRPDNPRFAFSMAFADLCKIKAQESGGTILGRELAELMTVPKTAVRTLSAVRSLM
jgi:RNA-dependent RNA polymerase